MYELECLVYQGENKKPQYKWTPLARCSNKALLEVVLKQMHRQEDWRISPMSFSFQQAGTWKGCA